MAPDRRRARQEALVRALDAEGLDGLLVTSRANIRYLTGFSGSAALVAVTRGDVLLVTDFRYDEQARAEAGAVARVEVEGTSVWDRFFRELATLGPLTEIGYEAHALTVHDARRFAEAGKPWRPASGCCWTSGRKSTGIAPTSRAPWSWARGPASGSARCMGWCTRRSDGRAPGCTRG